MIDSFEQNTKYEDNSNEELWQKFLGGDMRAFHVIYNSHYKMLYSFGLKFLNPAKVEDCIHDTFINILNYKNSLREVKNVKAYLFKSLRNQALKSINKNKLEFSLIEGIIPQEVDDNDDNKEKVLDELRRVVEKLSSREKEIVYLKYLQEFNNMEISEMLGIKYQTVRNILAGAIKKLRVLGKGIKCC